MTAAPTHPIPALGAVGAALLAVVVALALGGCSGAQGTPLAGVGSLPAPASAWPGAQYDARHSSGTPATGPQTGAIEWTSHLDGAVAPGPVIGVDGSLLVATNAGTLNALDPATGTVRWTLDGGSGYGADLSTSPAVLADGTILWPGPGDTLFAVGRSGHLLWKDRFDGQVLSPAVGGNHRVYVADMTGRLDAIRVSGSQHHTEWTIALGGTDYASPAIGQNGQIYTSDGAALIAVRDYGDHGGVAWKFPVTKMIEVSPAVAPDGTVVIGTNNDLEYGVHPDGTKAWGFRIHDYTYSSTSIRPDGMGVFADNSGRIRLFSSKTGTVIRTLAPATPGKEHVWTSVVLDAKGDTYWASTTHHVYGYAPDGSKLFTAQVDSDVWSYPALGADGTLYLGTTAGTVYAFRDR